MSQALISFLGAALKLPGGFMPTKEEVRIRRWSLVGGVLGGIILFSMFHWTISDPSSIRATHSFIFGSLEGWPSYARSFLPLDLAFTCFYVWLLYRTVIGTLANDQKTSSMHPIKIAGVFFCGFGSFGGVMGATLFGWYMSIECFFAMGLLMSAVAVVVCAFVAAVLGIGWLVVRWVPPLWERVRNTKPTQPLVKAGRFMNADDINGTEQGPKTP